ncbi:hypothetical protein SEA_LYMARA_52 [Arthrobacter phage Lymara]|uniref:DNA-binding phage zinc finger domain-containing protein n=1 Tax=Arthrobacter phage Lymara TaxID=2599828 RepID=A0A5J6TVL5_9CAUD|nr:hypothetical protein HYQ01_gp052 [Arthrobacter phage Lymara]QFG14853.1 hypothetical protein SEA_LYMARA_52 [Arthrobacter phage Lymara]
MPDLNNAAIALLAAASWATAETHTTSQVLDDATHFRSWLDEQDANYQASQRIKCPTCSAAPGNVCRDQWNGVRNMPHPDRINAAAATPTRGPLSVACVYCKVGIGEPCQASSGFVIDGFHTSREQAAQ